MMNCLRLLMDTQSMVQKCSVFRSLNPQQDMHQSKWSSHSPIDSEYIRDTSLKNKWVMAKKYTKILTTLVVASIQTYPQIIKIIKKICTTSTVNTDVTDQKCFTPFPPVLLLNQMHSTVLFNFHTCSNHKTYTVYQCTSSSCFT